MKTIFILASLLLSCASSNHNLYHNGEDNPHHLCEQTLYAIAPNTPIELHQPIRDAANYWNNIVGYKIFVDAGDIKPALDKINKTGSILSQQDYSVNSIYLRGLLAIGIVSYIGQSKDGVYHCGMASTSHNPKTSCITKERIMVSSSCKYDINSFQTIIRHEMGHLLGLRDVVDFTALMSYRMENTIQHPIDANEDEISAIKNLY